MRLFVTLVLVVGLTAGCGDASSQEEETAGATTATAETPAEAADPEASDEAPAVADPEQPSERVDATIENHLPTALADVVTAPEESTVGEINLVKISLPASVSLAPEGSNVRVEGAPAPTAAHSHNPAGDSGEDCPTLTETIEGLGDATMLAEHRFATMWDGDGPMYGNEIDLALFENGDQAGFFVRLRFDHGDDYTELCAASGSPSSPEANMTLDQAKALAGVFLTGREEL